MTFHSEKPEGIILKLSKAMIADYPDGLRGLVCDIEALDEGDGVEEWWNQKLTNLPKVKVDYCYLCYNGFIRYRLNVICYQRNVTKQFDTRIFNNANWVLLCGPVVKAPKGLVQKGFQGFRYTHKLF